MEQKAEPQEGVFKRTLTVVKDNLSSRRYLQNYPNDLLAGNLSRVPVYAAFDNAILGVGDDPVLKSMGNSLLASTLGWSMVYAFGNSMLSTVGGDFYQRHRKKLDSAYSATLTFGFGMAVNMAAGYNLKQALAASSVRAAIGIPLGPLTRYFTDVFREARGEKPIASKTGFRELRPLQKLSKLAAMVTLPLSLAFGTLALTPDEAVEHRPPQVIEHLADPREMSFSPERF